MKIKRNCKRKMNRNGKIKMKRKSKETATEKATEESKEKEKTFGTGCWKEPLPLVPVRNRNRYQRPLGLFLPRAIAKP
jgi:hypothetical protein